MDYHELVGQVQPDSGVRMNEAIWAIHADLMTLGERIKKEKHLPSSDAPDGD